MSGYFKLVKNVVKVKRTIDKYIKYKLIGTQDWRTKTISSFISCDPANLESSLSRHLLLDTKHFKIYEPTEQDKILQNEEFLEESSASLQSQLGLELFSKFKIKVKFINTMGILKNKKIYEIWVDDLFEEGELIKNVNMHAQGKNLFVRMEYEERKSEMREVTDYDLISIKRNEFNEKSDFIPVREFINEKFNESIPAEVKLFGTKEMKDKLMEKAREENKKLEDHYARDLAIREKKEMEERIKENEAKYGIVFSKQEILKFSKLGTFEDIIRHINDEGVFLIYYRPSKKNLFVYLVLIVTGIYFIKTTYDIYYHQIID